WQRRCEADGHRERIIAPPCVKPFAKHQVARLSVPVTGSASQQDAVGSRRRSSTARCQMAERKIWAETKPFRSDGVSGQGSVIPYSLDTSSKPLSPSSVDGVPPKIIHSSLRYRREIDGLRAVAVLPVIFFHAGVEALSGGFVGVDVFFV